MKELTISDVTSDEYAKQFIYADLMTQTGFFKKATWIRFELDNQSSQKEWLLELTFPLIYQILIYSEDELGITKLYQTESNYPSHQR